MELWWFLSNKTRISSFFLHIHSFPKVGLKQFIPNKNVNKTQRTQLQSTKVEQQIIQKKKKKKEKNGQFSTVEDRWSLENF